MFENNEKKFQSQIEEEDKENETKADATQNQSKFFWYTGMKTFGKRTDCHVEKQ